MKKTSLVLGLAVLMMGLTACTSAPVDETGEVAEATTLPEENVAEAVTEAPVTDATVAETTPVETAETTPTAEPLTETAAAPEPSILDSSSTSSTSSSLSLGSGSSGRGH